MSAHEEILQLPGTEGFQAWRVKGKDTGPEKITKASAANWIGIPARLMVSLPMRFHGIDAARRESAAQLELEGAGLGMECERPNLFESRVYDEDARDQRAWTCLQAAPLPKEVLAGGVDAQYAPSVCFQDLTAGQAAVWQEAGSLVLALPDAEAHPMHFQALTGRELDEDAAAEIRCILAATELSGTGPEIEGIQWLQHGEETPGIEEQRRDFQTAVDLPVAIESLGAPRVPSRPWRLVPETIVQQRQARSQRRLLTLVASGTLLVIAAGLSAFAAGLWKRQEALKVEVASLAALEPRLEQIRNARSHWSDLEVALTPQQYPVEMFFQIVELLPPEGIRMTLFEMDANKLTVAGEASSVNHAISFREDLTGAPALKDWGFVGNNPSVLPDGRATFQAEGTRPVLADIQ